MLKDIDPQSNAGVSKADSESILATLGSELSELQELHFASGHTGILIVLQGMDTSGKDGAIRHLLKFMNAQSTKIVPFKQPTTIELEHDFLWRIHQRTPGNGECVIFNRSHYEDVLVVRVHELVPIEVWSQRYEQINAFEDLLVKRGVIVLKFFLHISKGEQEQRLIDREQDPVKAWKLSVGDWKERVRWDDYQAAYQDALNRCSANEVPWHVIPANRKWYRNLAITEAVVHALRPFKPRWEGAIKVMGDQAKAEIAAYRASRP